MQFLACGHLQLSVSWLGANDACFAFAVSDSGRWVKLGRKVVKAQGKVSKNFDIGFRVRV